MNTGEILENGKIDSNCKAPYFFKIKVWIIYLMKPNSILFKMNAKVYFFILKKCGIFDHRSNCLVSY
ncbi:arginine/ornithine transport system ATPase [Polaribacter irgensii 23-P]|uniref:Arginine/ornithine transport system ATPase n=1 Tax=Polaribacter irgensii 23-P TaxID=313594 RepID=A4C0V6_9FLAO|nr:arginine/ornithine transport system ATPase [Polaribacter irgensii 23-P]